MSLIEEGYSHSDVMRVIAYKKKKQDDQRKNEHIKSNSTGVCPTKAVLQTGKKRKKT